MSTKLDASGAPTSLLQWVNFNTSGTQETPALSGRYSPSNATIVSYMDLSSNQLIYKGLSCAGSPFMREAELTEMYHCYKYILNLQVISLL